MKTPQELLPEIVSKNFYVQKKGDGKLYFFASVTMGEKWFFGLLTWRTTWWLAQWVDEGRCTYYLTEYEDYSHSFEDLEKAKELLNIQIERWQKETLRDMIVSFEKLKNVRI